MIGLLFFLVLRLYLLILLGRIVLSWVPAHAPGWRPRGVILVAAEAVYMLTDPPLRWIRRLVPMLRLGGTSLDVSLPLLFMVVQVTTAAVRQIPV